MCPADRMGAGLESLLARAQRAIDDMRLHGIRTTANYYQQILKHPDFRSREFDTSLSRIIRSCLGIRTKSTRATWRWHSPPRSLPMREFLTEELDFARSTTY